MAENEVDLDSIIDRLLEVRGSRPGKQVQLLETEIRYLCTKAREIFISQPILLELEAPIKVRYLIHTHPMPCYEEKLTCYFDRFAEIFTDSTTTFFDYSSTADSPQRPTTSSLVTTLIVESSRSRPSASSWRTRSSTRKTSSCSVSFLPPARPCLQDPHEASRLSGGNHECASINRIYGFYDECASSPFYLG